MPRLLLILLLLAAGSDAFAQNPPRVPRLVGEPRPVTRRPVNFPPRFGYYPVPFGFNSFGGYYFVPTGYGLNAGFSPRAEARAAPLDVSGVGFGGTFSRAPADPAPKFVPQDTVVTRWRSIVGAGPKSPE